MPVMVWKSLAEKEVDILMEDFRAGENSKGLEGQCDRTNLQTEGGIQDCRSHMGIKIIYHTMKMTSHLVHAVCKRHNAMQS